MAKKRKVRASEPESSTKTPETQLEQPIESQEEQPIESQEEPQIEQQEEPQIEPQEEEEQEQQQIEEQQEQINEEDTEQEPEQPQNMEEDQKEILEQEGNDGDTLNISYDDASAKQQASPEANGGEKSGDGVEEDEEELEEEPVEKLLEPFSKEQLFVLIKEAVSKYPELIESVQKLADADPAHRKIFVHGLGWDSNVETLTSEFGRYGEIEDCKVVCDKVSGKSKGYAFLLFKHRSGAQKALREPQKKIGNRMTSCQLASAGPVPAPPPIAPPVSEYTQRKIFVSNVSADLEPQKLLEFFSKFGEIEDGPLGLDKQTGKPKGFALFVYKSVDSARKALEEPHKNYEGHVLHCQRAIDGPKPNKPYYQQQHHHQHHQHQQQPQHQQYHHYPSKKGKYSSSGGSGPGHLMAPSGPPVGGYNPAVTPQAALTPALGQALTALLATQGAGLGISNLLGGLGAPANQGVPPVMNNAGYGNQGGGGGAYGSQPQGGYQGGYQNPQGGYQGSSSRPQQGGGSYMGHGH